MLFVYLQPSLLIFCKIGYIIFLYRHLQQRPQEWRTHFQFSTLDYHRFFSFFSYLLWSTSQLPSIMSLSEEITLTLKKALWPVVQKLLIRRTLILRWASLFCLLPVEDLHYWLPEELVPFSHWRIFHQITLTFYLILHCVLTWWNHLSCKKDHVLHQMVPHRYIGMQLYQVVSNT